jgi:hypothetical protein
MLIHFEIEYCLTGQLITLTERSKHSQMIEKVGQIGLTPLVIEIRFAVRARKNSQQAQIINNPSQYQRRSESDAT